MFGDRLGDMLSLLYYFRTGENFFGDYRLLFELVSELTSDLPMDTYLERRTLMVLIVEFIAFYLFNLFLAEGFSCFLRAL